MSEENHPRVKKAIAVSTALLVVVAVANCFLLWAAIAWPPILTFVADHVPPLDATISSVMSMFGLLIGFLVSADLVWRWVLGLFDIPTKGLFRRGF